MSKRLQMLLLVVILLSWLVAFVLTTILPAEQIWYAPGGERLVLTDKP